MFVEYRPVDYLLEYLRGILMGDDFESAQRETTYENGVSYGDFVPFKVG